MCLIVLLGLRTRVRCVCVCVCVCTCVATGRERVGVGTRAKFLGSCEVPFNPKDGVENQKNAILCCRQIKVLIAAP